MKHFFLKLHLCLLFVFVSSLAIGQEDFSNETKNVEIIYSDSSNILQEQGRILQRLQGDVQLKLDSVFFYCDSAIIDNDERVIAYGNIVIQQTDSISTFADSLNYDVLLKTAVLMGDTVILVNGSQQLFTNELTYQLDKKVATYFSGATLYRGETQLSSKIGYYYVEPDIVYFKDSVVVIDPKFNLKTDTLQFDVGTKTVYFVDSTLITSDTSKIYCQDGYYDTENGFAEFRDNAQFKRGDQVGRADVIQYDQEIGEFTLFGLAWIEAPNQLAEADTIKYNENTELFQLSGNARFKEENRLVQSRTIIYDGKDKTFLTTGRSFISEPPQILEADEVDFREESGIGFAYGGVIWRDTSADLTIFCDTAQYNRSDDFLKAIGGRLGRPLLITILEGDSLFLAADTLLAVRANYFEEQARLRDSLALVRDSLSRIALKDSLKIRDSLDLTATKDSLGIRDSLNLRASKDSIGISDSLNLTALKDSLGIKDSLSLVATKDSLGIKDSLNLAATNDSLKINKTLSLAPPDDAPTIEEPFIMGPFIDSNFVFTKDTILQELSDQLSELDSLGKDSLSLDSTALISASDTLIAQEDTTRYLLAYNDVRIFKNDLQALCDSLTFNSKDSIFTFFNNPVIWSDTSQLAGDTIRMLLKNSTIDRAFLDQKAIIINSTKEGYFNQIKGKHVTAFFKEGDITRMLVEGNAESVYYAQDETGAYVGVNKTLASEMVLYFIENEIDRIRFLNSPEGTADPMKGTNHGTMRLDGFKWFWDIRPQSIGDLFLPRENLGREE